MRVLIKKMQNMEQNRGHITTEQNQAGFLLMNYKQIAYCCLSYDLTIREFLKQAARYFIEKGINSLAITTISSPCDSWI